MSDVDTTVRFSPAASQLQPSLLGGGVDAFGHGSYFGSVYVVVWIEVDSVD